MGFAFEPTRPDLAMEPGWGGRRFNVVTHRPLTVALLVLLAACSTAEQASIDSTTTLPPTTTTSIPSDQPTTSRVAEATTTTSSAVDEIAWTEAEAERHVENYLAALAAGAFEQAGWPAFNNGIVIDGQQEEELPSAYLERTCAESACAGPYEVTALGPGLIDPTWLNAASEVLVTHRETGDSATIRVVTFEGQLIIDGLPPLVPGGPVPTLVEALFGDDPPDRVVVQRFDAFEVWQEGSADWVTNWWSNDSYEIEGGWAVVLEPAGARVVSVVDPTDVTSSECPSLVSRDGVPVVVERCWSDGWRLFEADSGVDVEAPVPFESLGDGQYLFFEERGGTVISGYGDAEGNLTEIRTEGGVDVLGDDYAGYVSLSSDGRLFAYVDHADPAALSHFWSPVVVVKDVATGAELGRWTVDRMIGCLEFAKDWLVVCEVDLSEPASPEQIALVAIDIDSNVINRIESRTRLFLP